MHVSQHKRDDLINRGIIKKKSSDSIVGIMDGADNDDNRRRFVQTGMGGLIGEYET